MNDCAEGCSGWNGRDEGHSTSGGVTSRESGTGCCWCWMTKALVLSTKVFLPAIHLRCSVLPPTRPGSQLGNVTRETRGWSASAEQEENKKINIGRPVDI